jgi:L-fuculokinase
MNITVVFDIGRTNKKYIVFDESYGVVEEFSESLPETEDEDGFPTENLALLTDWVRTHWKKILDNPNYNVRSVNATAYGASFVHLNENHKPVGPLYSYLKPFPEEFSAKFYGKYGTPDHIALQTGSPNLGFLNSGKQLFWLKYARPEIFREIRTSLHLPQYIIYLLTGRKVAEYTSIGCHTALWSFEMMDYHDWVKEEDLYKLFPPAIAASSFVARQNNQMIQSGFGLHDSSSALLPYKMAFKESFILVSTGTWCINFNPFNARPLTSDQLDSDCLHFMSTEGSGVKASRLFMGREHDEQLERIITHFGVDPNFHKSLDLNPSWLEKEVTPFYPMSMEGNGPRPEKPAGVWDIAAYSNAEEAYHGLMKGLTDLLSLSLSLIGVNDVQSIYIDGGFARNKIFTKLVALRHPNHKVYSTELPQATALGAALHITRPQSFEFPGEISLVEV